MWPSEKQRHKNWVSPNKRCTDPLQGCSENKWVQAWKLVLDGHNLAGGHEVFLFPRARIWKNFIPRFRPSQQSLMDHEYPYVPVFQQKSSSSPGAKAWAQSPGLPLLALGSYCILLGDEFYLHTVTLSLRHVDFPPCPLRPLSGFTSQHRKTFPTQGDVIHRKAFSRNLVKVCYNSEALKNYFIPACLLMMGKTETESEPLQSCSFSNL